LVFKTPSKRETEEIIQQDRIDRDDEKDINPVFVSESKDDDEEESRLSDEDCLD
jgi:hypothetical protein